MRIKNTSITVDDYMINPVEDNYDHTHWTQICESCRKKHNLSTDCLDEAGGICGVEGCDKEASHYLDFNGDYE